MKSKVKFLSIVIVTLLLMTGCGSQNNEEINQKEMSFVDDLNREVSYSTDAIVSDWYTGELLYLDANVVGADLTYASSVWDQDKVNDVVNVGQSIESIATLSPTLIITIHEDLIDQYELIAPTIYIQSGKYKPLELMEVFGEILGQEEMVATLENSFNQRVEEIKGLIDHPEYTYTIEQDLSGTPTLYGNNWGRGGFILYDYLGLSGTEAGEEKYVREINSYLSLETESLPEYIGDVVIIFADTDTPGYEENSITQNPLFEETNAFINNNIYYIDDDYIYDDPYSVEYLLDYFESMFEGEL